MIMVNVHTASTEETNTQDKVGWQTVFIVVRSLWNLSSVGFGNTQFNLPYVAEVFTRYSMDFFGLTLGLRVVEEKRHTFTCLSGVIFMKYR